MANLRVDKITSTETFETTGSVQFDGVDDGLTISDNVAFDLGTGDFTIEGWYYLVNAGTYQSLMDWRGVVQMEITLLCLGTIRAIIFTIMLIVQLE